MKSKSYICFVLMFCIIMCSTFALAAEVSAQSEPGPVFYINHCEKPYKDSMRIFKYENGKTAKLSQNMAYQLAELNDVIYFMKIDFIEGQDGFVQRGTIWQIDKNGKNEKSVLETSIYTLTSDGEYLYFCGDEYRGSIMRMKPGESPEEFYKVKSFHLIGCSGDWLYYVDNTDTTYAFEFSVNRINTKTGKNEKIIDAFEYGGYFTYPVLYGHTLILYMWKDDISFSDMDLYKVDANTKKIEKFDLADLGTISSIVGIQKGVLVGYNYDEDKMEFIDLEKEGDKSFPLVITANCQFDNQMLVVYELRNNTSKKASFYYGLLVWTDYFAELHFIHAEDLEPGEIYHDFFPSQFINGGIGLKDVRAILVKFDDYSEMDDFRKGVPWDDRFDYYVIKMDDEGEKWLFDIFGVKVDFFE